MAGERNDPERKEEREGAATEAKAGAPPAGGAEAGKAGKASLSQSFSRKGILILAVLMLLEAAVFLLYIGKSGKASAGAEPAGAAPEGAAATQEQDLERFFETGRAILDLGEIKVPVTSTQPRAPRSMSASFQVVITKELGERLGMGGGGGHGGGGKAGTQQKVLELNVRSILREMMDGEGIRLLEPSAKADFRRKAKDRLNHVQVDGDEEETAVLKILRGQVLQVILDKFETQPY